jgi:NADP-dependent 3-hydroxy acid dehydrogenase YdfG
MGAERKIAIVTGAGSGIGKAITIALLKEGYSVVLAGRRPEALEQTMSETGHRRSACLAVPIDVSNPSSVRDLTVCSFRPAEGVRSPPSE